MVAFIGVIVVIAFVVVVCKILMADGKRSVRYNKAEKQSKAKDDQANAKIGLATALASTALVHKINKHHAHEESKVFGDDRIDAYDDDLNEFYDDDLNEFYDDELNESYDADYEYQRAAYEEEQAAYDDFIYSLDEGND